MTNVLASIDHFMWAAADLDLASNKFEDLTGVSPAFGGVHPGFGTRNALASLENGRYIEIVALDPEQTPENPLAKQIALLQAPAILAFHVQRQDLESAAQIYSDAGIPCTGPFHLERKRPDGKTLRWRLLIPDSSDFGRAVPIFIDWMQAPHPAKSAPEGCELIHFKIGHPNDDKLLLLYEQLGLGITVQQATTASATAILKTPKGEVSLQGQL